jgi:hypothetical protein
MNKYSVGLCFLLVFVMSGCKQTPVSTQPALSNAQAQTVSEKEAVILPRSLALLPFSNETEKPDAADMLRTTLFGHLARTNYDIPHIQHVDNRLAILDPKQSLTQNDAPLITQILGVDGLLLGRVMSYDTIYAGIYAQITFKVEITMVDNQGSVLWKKTFEEISREGGLSTNAWSLLYSMAVTAMHLEDENLFAVADKMGRNIAANIIQPDDYQYEENFIETVIHDSAGRSLRYSDRIKVGIKGDANKQASVMLQGVDDIFPLVEDEPGVYLAEIPVAQDWHSDGMMLTGYLRASDGRVSKAISPAGLIRVDNQSPKTINNLNMTTNFKRVTLDWDHEESEVIFNIYRKTSVGLELLTQTQQSQIEIEHGLSPFEMLEVAIVAVDPAGNESRALDTRQVIYPLSNLYDATVLTAKNLPAILEGQILLRKHHSPFLIDRQTVLSSGSSLFIEPGTEIEFSAAGNLLVQGSIFTFGADKIIVKPVNEQLTAQTFLTIDSNEHVQLQGIQIERAGIAIDVIKGKALISECTILHSQYSALVVSQNAKATVTNCLIDGSNTSAIVVTGQANVSINDSKLINNFPFHIQHASHVEMDATNNEWSPKASPMTILGSVRY